MRRAVDKYTIELCYEPGAPAADLALLADALFVLHLHTGSALDTALQLAHDLNATSYQQQVHDRALIAAADELRTRLAQIEERLRRVA